MELDRRSFMATSAAAVAAAGGRNIVNANHAEALNLSKAEIPTPALLVELDLLEQNIGKVADHCRQTGKGFRPHAKTHKCPDIAKKQLVAGALGISVATVPEAAAMVEAGIRGVLLTSPIMEKHKISRMVELNATENGKRNSSDTSVSPGNPALMLAVGDPKQVEMLSTAAKAQSQVMNVLIDLDVGDRRTGAFPGQPAVELAKRIVDHAHLRLWGVQAYAGHASHAVGFENRKRVSEKAMTLAAETRALLLKSGFHAPILSGGSTGTYNIDTAIAGFTELQVGSFAFMDLDYRRIGGMTGASYNDFRFSLTVLSTVISATHADRVTIDAGIKAFATDQPFHPEAKDGPEIAYSRGGDEFGVLTCKNGKLPKLGDRLEFYVPHCDPTVNLYDRIYAMRGGRVEAVWPVVARKEAS